LPRPSSRGFTIAAVTPEAMVMAKNVGFLAALTGNPKEMLEAPHETFTPSSSR